MRHICRLTCAVAMGATVALTCALGTSVASAKENPANDCLVGLQGPGEGPGVSVNVTNLTVSCTDGDSCDSDGATDGSCSFRLRGCVNIGGVSGCEPRPIKKVKFNTGNEKNLIKLTPDATEPKSVCGDFVDFRVALKKNGSQPGKRKIIASATANVKPSGKNKDSDAVTFICNPCTNPGGCVPATTTTSITTTTTTTSISTTTTTLYTGMGAGIGVSSPPNNTHFVAGDRPVVRVLLADDSGQPLSLADLGTANLYMYGPQDESLTTTPLALLRASGDRNARPHHYIDLKTNPDVVVSGNVVSYPLSAVTNELPGTYTVAVWAVLKSDPLQQWMPLADLQIGTSVVETQIVGQEKCASCHLGAANDKFYMHHIDPGFSPTGNPALDSTPVRNCKACHNQDGYAAFNNGAGGNDANVSRTPDPIVRRVHGVHRGAELALPFNNDPATGDFKSYIHLEFPGNLRDCTTCHLDGRSQTGASRQACGACHDNIWFGSPTATPAGYTNHDGGEQDTDNACVVCHGAGAPNDSAVAHAALPSPLDAVDVSLTPPANGTHYVAGEMPVVTIVIRNDNGNPIDHTVVNSTNFTTAALMVSGPRALTLPVLTNRALYGNGKLRASASNSVNGPWTFPLGTETLKIAVNGDAPLTLTVPSSGSLSAAAINAWLTAQLAGVTGGVTVTSTSTRVTIKSNLQGANSRIDIYASAVTTIMGWKPAGVTMEPYPVVAQGSYPFNDLRNLNVAGWDGFDYVDPNVTRNTGNITYQLLDVAGLTPGTYSVYVWSRPAAGKVANLTKVGIGFLSFQVGTATAEKKIATNCTNCHADTLMHDPRTDANPHSAPFDTDYCKSCHDYSHYSIGEGFSTQGGTSLSGWSGFGAVPIARRVHGVHFGRYLAHPEQVYAGTTSFAEVIFPQDVRNCTKCHSDTDDWTTKPSRLACLGCHDSDAAQAHGKLMTSITDPRDPYGPGAIESCGVCHGADAPWAASVVHNISSPYVPPYLREP